MNARGGAIVRLIDVAMIILIGFLGVADLDERTTITLPTAWETTLDTLQLSQRRLVLTASAGDLYHLELQGAMGLRRPLGSFFGADTLKAVLSRAIEQQKPAGVDIDVAPEAEVQSAVNAVDACELLELERNLSFQTPGESENGE